MAACVLGGLMNYLTKEYKKRCKEEFGKYGFNLYSNNHYRVINDVFQSFNLHRSVSGSDCTVQFGIIPLSVAYDLDKTSGNPCHLKKFENSGHWFNYDRNSLTSIDMCITNMFAYMKKYLMPLFEKAEDCKSAYAAICEYDHVFAGNSYERFCMCLKFGDYEAAKFHLEAVICQHERAYKRNKEVFGENITQDYVQKMEKKISEKQRLLKLIEGEDYNSIQEWLILNENRNKQNLGIKF